MMLHCALPVNVLSSFIQRTVVKRPNKDQINTEEAHRVGFGFFAVVGSTWVMENAIIKKKQNEETQKH